VVDVAGGAEDDGFHRFGIVAGGEAEAKDPSILGANAALKGRSSTRYWAG
jgi:hypothetical protein